MKTANSHTRNENRISASLYQLVDQVIKTSSATAACNRNSVINNVSPKFHIHSNSDIITSVIGEMLHAVVINSTDSVIYVSAKEWYDKMIEVNIKDENCYNTYAIALSLQDSVPIAEGIGGHLDIINQRQKITTISFRFPIVHGRAA